MAEKPPAFVVNDRRKFTADGELREGFAPSAEPPVAVAEPVAAEPATTPAKVVTMPSRSTVEAEEHGGASRPGLEPSPIGAAGYDVDGDGLSSDEDAEFDQQAGPAPTAAEREAQHRLYSQSAREMDALLARANPGAKPAAKVGFEHLVQSFYLSAIMAMGAGTEPGEKPRIDILGARQAIDMLAVLEEKTRGNVTEKESQMVQGVAFELRMMFLELTNAIAAQAQQAAPPPLGRR